MKRQTFLYFILLSLSLLLPLMSLADKRDSSKLKALFISFNAGGDGAYWKGPHSFLFGPDNFGVHSQTISISCFFKKNNYLELSNTSEYQDIPEAVVSTGFLSQYYLSNSNGALALLYGKAYQKGALLLVLAGGISYVSSTELTNIQQNYSGGWFPSSQPTYDEVNTNMLSWQAKGKIVISIARWMALNTEVYATSNKFGLHTCYSAGLSFGLMRRYKLH